jgi:hypothetical protein
LAFWPLLSARGTEKADLRSIFLAVAWGANSNFLVHSFVVHYLGCVGRMLDGILFVSSFLDRVAQRATVKSLLGK